MKTYLKTNKLLIIIILFSLIALIGGTYAIIVITVQSNKTNTITAGELILNLSEGQETINLSKAYPLTDNEGQETTIYKFNLTNDGKIDSNYTITLKDLDIDSNKTRMLDKYVKYKLTINGTKSSSNMGLLSDLGRTLDTGILKSGESNNYQLQLWMDFDAPNEAQATIFKAKLVIEGEQAIK